MFFHSKYEGEQHRAIKKKTDKKLTQKSQEPPYKCLTMDDMLIPCGDWKEHYSRRNKNYNIIFAVGLVSLIGSIYIVSNTNYTNYCFAKAYSHFSFEIFNDCYHEMKLYVLNLLM